MGTPKFVQAGDPCPMCDSPFRPLRVPTDEQWARFTDRERPTALPQGYDTATPADRVEHGALHRCVGCGYQTRFQPSSASARTYSA